MVGRCCPEEGRADAGCRQGGEADEAGGGEEGTHGGSGGFAMVSWRFRDGFMAVL